MENQRNQQGDMVDMVFDCEQDKHLKKREKRKKIPGQEQ
jgi:hypothetical protein